MKFKNCEECKNSETSQICYDSRTGYKCKLYKSPKLQLIREITDKSDFDQCEIEEYKVYVNQLKKLNETELGDYKIIRYTNYNYEYDYYYHKEKGLVKICVYCEQERAYKEKRNG